MTTNTKNEKEMFIYTQDNLYIAMDNSSGGYPYETSNFMRAKVWYSKDEAEKYKSMFNSDGNNGWELKKLNGLDLS